MDGTWRETAKAERRERYLEAAARLFAARGYDRVSVGDLSAAAGVSGPALYRHFSGKEAMLLALLHSASERLLLGGEAVVATGGEPGEVLAALVRFHADFAVSERDVIRVQDQELERLAPAVSRPVRRLQRRYVELWAGPLGRVLPAASGAELEIRLHGVFGLLNSTPRHPLAAAMSEVRELLVTTALAALTAEGARGSALLEERGEQGAEPVGDELADGQDRVRALHAVDGEHRRLDPEELLR